MRPSRQRLCACNRGPVSRFSRFERKLCEEVKLHLGYRWFCRLELDDKIPDHSTFSVNRHGRFRDSDILRQVFEVRACMDAGLVKGEGFAVDASVIEADASRYHGKAPGEIDWSAPERQTRAVTEFLTALDDEGADADRKPPKTISPADPCSAWTATRASCRAPTLRSTASAISTSALRVSFSGRLGRCTMAGQAPIVRAPATAAHVSSSPSALRT